MCKSIEEAKQTNASNKEIKDLLKIIIAKDEKINELEHREDELEQHSRQRNVIVTDINLHSYTHNATHRSMKASNQHNDGFDICESTMVRKNFASFAEEKLRVSVGEIEITAIHDLPKRKDGSTPVIVQFLFADKNRNRASKKETEG